MTIALRLAALVLLLSLPSDAALIPRPEIVTALRARNWAQAAAERVTAAVPFYRVGSVAPHGGGVYYGPKEGGPYVLLERGLSPRDYYRLVSHEAYHAWQFDYGDPTLATMLALAGAFGVRLSRLVESLDRVGAEHRCPFCGGCRVSPYCCFTTCYCEDGP